MMTTFSVARGGARVVEFRIKGDTGFRDLSSLAACTLVVDGASGDNIYAADCPIKPNDNTVRLATFRDAATATVGLFSACVHWTDANGLTDAEPCQVKVYAHAV